MPAACMAGEHTAPAKRTPKGRSQTRHSSAVQHMAARRRLTKQHASVPNRHKTTAPTMTPSAEPRQLQGGCCHSTTHSRLDACMPQQTKGKDNNPAVRLAQQCRSMHGPLVTYKEASMKEQKLAQNNRSCRRLLLTRPAVSCCVHHPKDGMHRRLGLRPILHSRRHCRHLLRDLLMPQLPLLLPNHVLHAAAAMPPLSAVRKPPHQMQPAPRRVRRHWPPVPVPAAATAAAAAVVLSPRSVGIVRLVVSVAAAGAAAAVVVLLLLLVGAVAAVAVCMVAPTMRRRDRASRADSDTSGTRPARCCRAVACQLIIQRLPQPLAAAVPVAAPVGRRRLGAPRAAAAAAVSAPLIPRQLLVPVCCQHTSCSPC